MKEHDTELVYVKEPRFSEETIFALKELGEVFKEIEMRLASEGYTIVEGKLKKLDTIKF